MTLNNSTKLFLAATFGAAFLTSLLSLHFWKAVSPSLFGCYLAIAIITAALKVRIPGVGGTYSLSFLPAVMAANNLPLAAVIVLALASAVTQSYWRALRSPMPVQVTFNCANFLLSGSAAFAVRIAAEPIDRQYLIFSWLGAALVYYIVNTGLTTIVIGLVEEKPLKEVFRIWSIHALPSYACGAMLCVALLTPTITGLRATIAGLCVVAIYWLMRHDGAPATHA